MGEGEHDFLDKLLIFIAVRCDRLFLGYGNYDLCAVIDFWCFCFSFYPPDSAACCSSELFSSKKRRYHTSTLGVQKYESVSVCVQCIYVAGKTYRRIIELKLNPLEYLLVGKKVSANRFNLMVICTPTVEERSRKKKRKKNRIHSMIEFSVRRKATFNFFYGIFDYCLLPCSGEL